jgi:hypothetical protein
MPLLLSATQVAEDATGEIVTLTCAGAVSYVIEGDDVVLGTFAIQGDKIVVQDDAVLDYESTSAYLLRIKALDENGAVIDQVDLTVANPFQVTNVDEAPVLNYNVVAAPDGAGAGTVVGIVTAVDPENQDLTYTLDPASEALFDLVPLADDAGYQIQVAGGVTLDYGNPAHRSVTVVVSDGANEVSSTIDLKEPSQNYSTVPVTEGAGAGTVVGVVTALDPGSQAFTYILDPQLPPLFELVPLDDGTGYAIQVAKGVTLDFETPAHRSVTVVVLDGESEVISTINLDIADVNDNAPTDLTLCNASVYENAAIGQGIGMLTPKDPDAPGVYTFTLVNANGDPIDHPLFAIAGDHVVVKAALDRETAGSHTIRVRADDGANAPYIKSFTITVNDANDNAPTGVTLSSDVIAEDAAAGTVIGTLSPVDVDTMGVYSYAIADASGKPVDHALFEIVGDKLRVKAGLDYEAAGTHAIKVLVADGVHESIQDFTITVTDVNDNAPAGIMLTGSAIAEDTAVGTVLGILSPGDPDTVGSYNFDIGDASGKTLDHALFEIVGNQLLLKGELDYETAANHTIRVRVSDGVNDPLIQDIQITITGVNDNAPTSIRVTGGLVAENAPVGKIFATLSTKDKDAYDAFTYTLVTGETDTTPAVHPLFEIDGDQIRLKTALDDAQLGLHELWVKSTDEAGHSLVQAITVGAYNVNEAPNSPNLTLTGPSVAEFAAKGTVVGSISVTDQDDEDVLTYRLVDDAGGRFEIEGGRWWSRTDSSSTTSRPRRTR